MRRTPESDGYEQNQCLEETRLGQVMKAGRVGCEWPMAHKPARMDGRPGRGVDCHSTCTTLEIRSNKAVASRGINFPLDMTSSAVVSHCPTGMLLQWGKLASLLYAAGTPAHSGSVDWYALCCR